MATQINSVNVNPAPTVVVDGGMVLFNGFTEADPDVVKAIENHHNPELAAHACLQIGARSLVATQTAHDAGILEKARTDLVAAVNEAASEHVERLIASTNMLIGSDDATIPTLVRGIVSDAVNQVSSLFDANSRSSIVAMIQEAVEKAAREHLSAHLSATRQALDPDNSDSPLGRWKTEVIDTLLQQTSLVLTQVTEVAAVIAARESRADTLTLTPIKGFELEERIHRAVSRIAARYGDLAEHVGTTTGANGSKVGDERVRINPNDAGGRSLGMMLEGKARKLSLPATLDELDRGMANREAQFGIAVFDKADNAPTRAPFSYYDNKAIVVLDDLPEEGLIELAYIWGRSYVRKTGSDTGEGLNPVRVAEVIADIQRAMGRTSVIRRSISTAGSGVRQAAEQLDEMDADVTEAVQRLRKMLDE